ncbi:MAG TPA: DUF2252 domain-containing protein [Acidimicrobiia bacterium]|jgi:uncharacterized protein (DUF2252 family)|nr:DUF2252 domain-containing protein [Acidimicrobiia bacterium]
MAKTTTRTSGTKAKRARVARLDPASAAAMAAEVLGGKPGTIDRADRIAAGRALRKDVPRDAHGDWQPAPDRPDPVAVLEAQGESRLPELLPIRYGRMAESQFGFFRGAAAGIAADLASTPSTGHTVQICGDAHLVNFGGFATPERRLIFDVNDFDETLPGPWEWDLKRLGASFAVAARAKGLSDDVGRTAVLSMVSSYRDLLTGLATTPTLDAWCWSIDTDVVVAVAEAKGDADTRRMLDRGIARAHAHSNLQAVNKLTTITDGRRRIVDQPPLVGHVGGDDQLDRMQALLDGYRASLPDDVHHLLDRFTLVDAARKVVGVGSVGTRCWIALLEGGGHDDPLILQIKEAQESVLEPHLGRSAYDNHARRAVEGQRFMQAASDMFLGWTHDDTSGVDYYWRNLRDMKVSANVNALTTNAFLSYAELCGGTLARAHARSGDAAGISGYLGKGDAFGKALGRFATTYADQNALDHEALVQAIKDGRVPAEPNV